MDDMGKALSGDHPIKMLGGGNPAHIPEVNEALRTSMENIMEEEGAFEAMIGNYDPPQGNMKFIRSLANLLRETYGWNITEENIALAPGSQCASFSLMNMLAGDMQDGTRKKVLLPIAPEYIGYADQGMKEDMFVSCKPTIECPDEHTFKYHVDFEHLPVDDSIAAICVSRPTNPTGNVVTDEEVEHLSAIAKERGIPLILDNAYGAPFPQILFTDITPVWDDHIILLMSLSKVGLPSVRTGIVIASPEIIKALSGITAIAALSNGTIGPYLAEPLVRSGEIMRLSHDVIRPFYEERAKQATAWLHESMDQSLPYKLHLCEGAIFLWLWLEDLPITAQELYERLKARDVIVVPGHYFFPGLEEEWRHKHECIRINYALNFEDVQEGVQIIAEEVKKAYAEGNS